MASEAAPESAPHPPPTFLEVKCKSSGKTRRFAVGTDAAFALSIINGKLDPSTPLALHIEAFKEGEEPIAFGPNSPLVNYGHGWHLHTLTELDFHHPVPKGERVRPVTTRVSISVPKGERVRPVTTQVSTVTSTDGSRPAEIVATPISFLYIGKIILAFILIFLLGLIFTLALENLPGFILFVKSSM